MTRFKYEYKFYDHWQHFIGILLLSYTYTEPSDNEFGSMYANKSWSGMIGQLERRVSSMIGAQYLTLFPAIYMPV